MAQLNTKNVDKMTPGVLNKLIADIRHATQNHDLDDGYELATGTKKHRLKVVPRVVMVLGSDTPDGSTGYIQGTFSLVNSTEILYSVGGKAYARILANK
jgi:hypothetical protein